MEKGRGKGTDTLPTDKVFARKEYIEREAALAFSFANGQYDHKNADTHFINGCESYREWLEAIPAADVVPVRHGRWILKDDGRAHCSECDTAGNSYVWRYCPNCGALMDKDGAGDA